MQIPPTIPLEKEAQYCIHCLAGSVERIFRDGRTCYRCSSCGCIEDRSLVIDNNIVWWIDEDRTYWHESVGVIVMDKQGKILCLLRKIFPFAYTLPAGHLDVGEKPEPAARRELQEETGLSVSAPLIHIADFPLSGDSCRRGSDDHQWHLFFTKLPSESTIRLNDEASSARWLTVSEVVSLSNATYPLQYIARNFGSLFRKK